MPMRSKAQRRFLHARHPDVADKFEKETPKGENLPEHVDGSRKKTQRKKRGRRK